MKYMKKALVLLPLFTLTLLLGGCGQVTGPISPLLNPPIAAFGSFDDGTTDGWVFDSSNPNITNPLSLIVTSQSFQGPYALEINVPSYGLSSGVTVQLTGYSVHYSYATSGPGLDLSNRILSMWVKLKSGVVTPPFQIGAQVFLKDASYQYANGTFVKLVPGQWMQVTFNVNAPNYQAVPAPDPAHVYQVGLQLAGNGSAAFTSDGIVDADSFGYQ